MPVNPEVVHNLVVASNANVIALYLKTTDDGTTTVPSDVSLNSGKATGREFSANTTKSGVNEVVPFLYRCISGQFSTRTSPLMVVPSIKAVT